MSDAPGVKFDTSKLRLDLIPPELEIAVAAALTYGAAKYDARNWEKGYDSGRAYAAVRRHLLAYWAGEDLDPETAIPHLWLAAAMIAILLTFEARGVGTDDRGPKVDLTQDLAAAYVKRALERLEASRAN